MSRYSVPCLLKYISTIGGLYLNRDVLIGQIPLGGGGAVTI